MMCKDIRKEKFMTRKEELIKIFENVEDTKGIIMPLIDDVVFLEEQLAALRKMPFIKVHPDYPDIQKPTAASKQYRELLQQYNQCIKIMTSIIRKDSPEEESPLRAFISSRKDK